VRSSSAAEIRTSESEPDAETPAHLQEARHIEHAVAEIGLRDRAEAGGDPASRHQIDLVRQGMGGVDQAPALIGVHRIEQEFDRTTAVARHAVLDLAQLLGHMNVHRAFRPALGGRAQIVEGDGAQRMRRDPKRRIRHGPDRLRARLDEALEIAGPVDEAALPGRRRRAPKIAVAVEHRQQRQPDPARLAAAAMRSAVSAMLP
jgi:hypothetical protein